MSGQSKFLNLSNKPINHALSNWKGKHVILFFFGGGWGCGAHRTASPKKKKSIYNPIRYIKKNGKELLSVQGWERDAPFMQASVWRIQFNKNYRILISITCVYIEVSTKWYCTPKWSNKYNFQFKKKKKNSDPIENKIKFYICRLHPRLATSQFLLNSLNHKYFSQLV